MGVAIATTLGSYHNPSTTYEAVTVANGDSLTVRNFASSDFARLEQIIRGGATAGAVRVRSPLLYDDVQGIRFETSENPSVMLLPPEVGQPLQPGDTLTLEVTGGTAEYDLAALVSYYSNLPGANARLHSWGDISGIIKNIVGVEVDVTTNATEGQWEDTVITTTVDLLKAGYDHAILGYVTDTALTVVGVKGDMTSNFRVCGPGSTSTDDTSAWFVTQGERHNTPHIPVFNADDKNLVYVSTADVGASTTAKITLVLAQLSQTITP